MALHENVKTRFVDAMPSHGEDKENVRISWAAACDFVKISHELGSELQKVLLTKGPGGLTGQKLFGFTVTVDSSLRGDDQFIFF
jgi:hypothetical protein